MAGQWGALGSVQRHVQVHRFDFLDLASLMRVMARGERATMTCAGAWAASEGCRDGREQRVSRSCLARRRLRNRGASLVKRSVDLCERRAAIHELIARFRYSGHAGLRNPAWPSG